MNQLPLLRHLILLSVFSCAFHSFASASKAGEEFNLGRLNPQGLASWWYGPEKGNEKSFVMILNQPDGLIDLQGKDRADKNQAQVRFDKQGRITSYQTIGRTIQSSFLANSVDTLMIGANGKKHRQSTREIILDASFACFGAGAFALYKPGDEVAFRASPPQNPSKDLETGAYECYLKVLGRSTQITPAGTFKCLDLELGFKGIAGLYAPKMLVWLDESSRRMVALVSESKDTKNSERSVVQAILP